MFIVTCYILVIHLIVDVIHRLSGGTLKLLRKACQSKRMIVWQKLTDKMTDSSPLMAKRESYHYPTFIVLTKKLLPVGRKLPFPLPQSSFRPVSDLKRKLRFYK